MDEVSGEGALPCPEYVATRHELLELARYWTDRVLFVMTTFFYGQQIGYDEVRICEYGARRLDRIAEVLGADYVNEIIEEVKEQYRHQMGERDWAAFERFPDAAEAVASLVTAKAWGSDDGK